MNAAAPSNAPSEQTPRHDEPSPFIPMRVAATGICCSVGNTTASASAAIRARMNYFRSGPFRDKANEPINVAMLYQVPLWGQQRLQHMYRAAMTECLGSLPGLESAEHLPPIALIGSEHHRGIRFQRSTYDLLASNQPEEGYDSRTIFGYLGKAGIAQALLSANAIFAGENPPEYVVVVGVDSFLDAASIQHFLAQNRILCPTTPDGFVPGEAAAAIALTPRPSPDPALWIEGVGMAHEAATPLNQDIPLRAIGLTRALRNAIHSADWNADDISFHASAISGEAWHFMEATLAMNRIMTREQSHFPHRIVAQSVGEIGAAFGPLMLAWIGTEMKPHRLGNQGLLHFSNDNGARTAVAVRHR